MIKKITGFALLLSLLSMLIVLTYAAFFVRSAIKAAPELDLQKIIASSSTKIYDKNDRLILELGLKKSEYTTYNQISSNMINAITAVEDERFFSHHGLDYKRLVGATLQNVLSKKYSEGASTISQQLIKNAFLTSDKTLNRKVQEMYLAYELEKYLTKEQILEAYLNNILFGRRIYGIERASNYYFGKKASELLIEEAAMLAGMIQLPNFYNPYINIEDTLARRNLVLYLMCKNKYISKEMMEDLQNKPIVLNKNNNLLNENFTVYSSYLDYVIQEAHLDYNFDLYGLDLKVYTNVDPLVQKSIYEIMNNETQIFPDDKIKAGIIFMDNKTGIIEGIGGQREFESLNVNYATSVRLQPASTIKPILEFAPAFEYLRYNPANLILDDKITYSNGELINNWDGQFKGHITIREALVDSRNIPALKLYQELDKAKIYEFLTKLNLHTYDPPLEAHSIGGFSDGFTVLAMTNAYQMFANEGDFIEAKAIRKIEFQNNSYSANNGPKRLLSKETSFLITDILHDAISDTSEEIKGMYLSAKTGQSNYPYDIRMKYDIPKEAVKDSWFIGYSKNKTLGVWTGYDFIDGTSYLDSASRDISRVIWTQLMRLYGIYDQKAPEVPSGLTKANVEIIGNKLYLADKIGPNTFTDYFLNGTLPRTKAK
ncbi:MAG: transglycosylase domain-containing protein [Erysipelotrichales bacterium]|nr:transglycosylase domain-containing protein [Erysipelotrichales bacterium]